MRLFTTENGIKLLSTTTESSQTVKTYLKGTATVTVRFNQPSEEVS